MLTEIVCYDTMLPPRWRNRPSSFFKLPATINEHVLSETVSCQVHDQLYNMSRHFYMNA